MSHFPLNGEGQARAFAANFLLTSSGLPHGPPSTCLGVRVPVGPYLSVARVVHELSSLAAAPTTLSLYLHCTVQSTPHNVAGMSPALDMEVQSRRYVSGWV